MRTLNASSFIVAALDETPTAAAQFVASWMDRDTADTYASAGGTIPGGSGHATVVDSPASGVRIVHGMTVCNVDAAAIHVSLGLDDGSSVRWMVQSVQLDAGETLQMDSVGRFQVLSAAGGIKTT